MWFPPGIHFTGNGCRLRRSTQHLPAVYLQEFGILRSFSVVDSRAARPGRAALESSQRDQCLVESTAVRADCVFVRAALPRALWIAKINLHVGSYREVLVFGHLQSAVPGQRAFQRSGKFSNMLAQGSNYSFCFFAPYLDQHGKT